MLLTPENVFRSSLFINLFPSASRGISGFLKPARVYIDYPAAFARAATYLSDTNTWLGTYCSIAVFEISDIWNDYFYTNLLHSIRERMIISHELNKPPIVTSSIGVRHTAGWCKFDYLEPMIGGVFGTTSLPAYFDSETSFSGGLMKVKTDTPPNSTASVHPVFTAIYSYNDGEYSTRAMHYIIQIVNSGGYGSAAFVWTKVPYHINPDKYITVGYNPMYGDGVLVDSDLTSVVRVNVASGLWRSVEGVWGEVRRPTPTQKDELYVIVLKPDRQTVEIYDFIALLRWNKIQTITYPLSSIQQITWFDGNIGIVDTSNGTVDIYVGDTSGNVLKIATTSIPLDSPYRLFAHPDQDRVYLIGETEQWVIYPNNTHATKTNDLTGLVGFDKIGFDEYGNIYIGGIKFDKDLNMIWTKSDPENWRFDFTYAVHKTSTGYELYRIDGTTPISNYFGLEPIYAALFSVKAAFRYPQKVILPYNDTDWALITQNGDLTNATWYGWDGTQWVPYDGTNARIISDVTPIELDFGVGVEFHILEGETFVSGDYFYFTVAPGLVMDDLTYPTVKIEQDLRQHIPAYIDITLVEPTVVVSGDYFTYTVPERSRLDFWQIDTFLSKATFDDPEQTGAGVDAIIKYSGDPQPGEVVINENEGGLKFNIADYGRTFQLTYDVVIDVDYPF